jgi:hypothetical protein
MAGYSFVVSGDAGSSREAVYSALQAQGFVVTPEGEWAARAERGSKAASLILGAFAGKKGRHTIMTITCQSMPDGNFNFSLQQETSGMSGGLIGMNQAKNIFNEVYTGVGTTLQNAGVLVSSTPLP